ncbi:MAG: methylenetetrahydrofolate reductase, partial [Muribaculaceae bacterium]|nr:methylenetetrahydrofolate reductase [Muribaculaceae bacterium]
MESVASFLASEHPTAFSFEILPPLRGKSINNTYADLDRLVEFNPAYINITTHRTEVTYRHIGGGSYRQATSRRRPGTVAIAAVIRERYGVRPVPHIICGEYSRREICG